MPNNPVQIILNDDVFLKAPEPGAYGPEKDFFENSDSGFAKHKDNLLSALDTIKATICSWSYGPAAYLRVQMRVEALVGSRIV